LPRSPGGIFSKSTDMPNFYFHRQVKKDDGKLSQHELFAVENVTNAGAAANAFFHFKNWTSVGFCDEGTYNTDLNPVLEEIEKFDSDLVIRETAPPVCACGEPLGDMGNEIESGLCVFCQNQ